MKKFIFLMLLSLLVQGCNSQKSKTIQEQPLALSPDSLQPQVDIRVNKKYDNKGNLIQYDSTYSYFYSSSAGKTQELNTDSFYTQFRSLFHSRYDELFKRSLNPIFFNDSLYKYDFFNPDYFNKRFELNRSMFSDMFKEMDSLKSEALKKHYPNGIMKPKD